VVTDKLHRRKLPNVNDIAIPKKCTSLLEHYLGGVFKFDVHNNDYRKKSYRIAVIPDGEVVMILKEAQLPMIGNPNTGQSQYVEDVFQKLQNSGFKYMSVSAIQLDDNTPDDEVIEAHSVQIEGLMNDDSYDSVEVISLQNYSHNTGSYVYKPVRDQYETRLITHGQCSLFVVINKQTFEFQCRQGDIIRLPAEFCYWLEVGAHACRYIHLYMTEDGWDRPSNKQDIQPCTLTGTMRHAG